MENQTYYTYSIPLDLLIVNKNEKIAKKLQKMT